MTTRGSSGHLGPLVPLAQACTGAGHDVLVSAQRRHGANVERAGLDLLPVGDPPDEEWMPFMDRVAQMHLDDANALMVSEFFARMDTRAALPDLRSIVESWKPDLIVRESWEFASTLVAALYEVPLARVGLALAAVEEMSLELAAGAVHELGVELGLAPDPGGARLRAAPYFTMVPEELEDPAAPLPQHVHRFRPRAAERLPALPDWWPGDENPLVYLSFGSVAAAPHLPYFPELYRAAIDALAPLPARVLVTLGESRDLEELGPLPPNVHVETWVAQDAVTSRAAVVVCHGGYGSTLGALSLGAPLVVLPLFSVDQWANSEAVARAGAGLGLHGGGTSQRGLELPAAHTLGELRPAVERVLGDPAYRREAERIAAAMHALPSVDAAVEDLTEIAAKRP